MKIILESNQNNYVERLSQNVKTFCSIAYHT